MCQIYEDRFLLEEVVCRWHMTDEKKDIDRKDSFSKRYKISW